MGFFGRKKKHGFEEYGNGEVKKERLEKAKALMKQDAEKFKAFGSKVLNVIAPPKTAEQIAFEKKLSGARQESYQKESLRQAKLSGRKAAMKNASNGGLPPLPNLGGDFFDIAAGPSGKSKGKKKQKFRTGMKELDDLDRMMGM